MSYVHDNTIQSYHVDMINEKMELTTSYYDKEMVTVLFSGYCAHLFENVTCNNIIFDIYELSIEKFIDIYGENFDRWGKYSFPFYYESGNEFISEIKGERKIYYIQAVVGLDGFVIAENIHYEKHSLIVHES